MLVEDWIRTSIDSGKLQNVQSFKFRATFNSRMKRKKNEENQSQGGRLRRSMRDRERERVRE